MDDSPVQETKIVSKQNDTEEIDPLDAYMLEIDEQVTKLDEKDKLKEVEEQAARKMVAKETEPKAIENDDEEDEEDETIGKAGNFATVEELIA